MKEPRYLRNGILEDEEQEILKAKKVAVIGCGGLGGYVVEMLARLGVGHLVLCDGDVFDETNLNRQLLAREDNLGTSKVLEATKRVVDINSSIDVTVRNERLTEENGKDILVGCDLVIDALDTPLDKIMLEDLCEEMNIPLIHGAISGWFGQVAVVFPGQQILRKFYNGQESGEDTYGNPSFTPALVASIQVSEAMKVMLGRGDIMSEKMTLLDLYFNEIKTVEV